MAETNGCIRPVIDLNKILQENDGDQIKQMQIELESNGWCFVQLPKELILSESQTQMMFDYLTKSSDKTRCVQRRPIYGYSKMQHKEGFKFLTGSYFGRLANKGLVPGRLMELLNYLSQHFDATTKRLIEVLDQYQVFQEEPSLEKLSEKANLPINEEHFGMLDIVLYFNDKNGFEAPINGENTDEVNCVPHFDPGLLSLSILSTLEGLQLKDLTTNTWIDGPLESHLGVIWLGAAAARVTNNRLKPGIHRVIYPKKKQPRLTMWFEVCTIEQLRNINEENADETMQSGDVTFDGLLNASPIRVLPGEKKLDFLRRIEMARGLSMSKAGPPRYHLKKYPIAYPPVDHN